MNLPEADLEAGHGNGLDGVCVRAMRLAMTGLAAARHAVCRQADTSKPTRRWPLCTAALFTLTGLCAHVALAQQAQSELFARLKPGLFVVEVTERESGNKILIGSGFLLDTSTTATGEAQPVMLIDADDVGDVTLAELLEQLEVSAVDKRDDQTLIATNYHVVSEHLLHPESYDLQVKNADDEALPMRVLAVDIVHDLALIAPTADSDKNIQSDWAFPLASEIPQQGDEIISMGNPYDIGISTVPGTYNGLLEKSYLRSIHFTGAVNPGMSGGPAVNRAGEVVGINVAGAGNSVSILVPVSNLQRMLQHYRTNPAADYSELRQQMRDALHDHQREMINGLLAQPWELSDFGPLKIPMEIADFITCTGSASTDEDELSYEYHVSDCGVYDRIYLSSSLETGPLEFDYGWYRSDKLNRLQLSSVMQQLAFSPFNRSGRKDVTGFTCRQDIMQLEQLGALPLRGVYCLRAYADYDGLYDVLFYAISVQDDSEAFYLHYTLSGVSREQAQAFNQRFTEAVAWN